MVIPNSIVTSVKNTKTSVEGLGELGSTRGKESVTLHVPVSEAAANKEVAHSEF